MKEVTWMVINSRKVGSQVILEKQTIVPVALYCTGPRRYMVTKCLQVLAYMHIQLFYIHNYIGACI